MRNRVKFDPKVDYYKIIHENVDITDQEIQKAYNDYVKAYAETKRKNQELLDQAIASKDSDLLSKAVLAMQASNSDFEEIDKAFEVLIYSREEYDKKRAKYLKDATKNKPVVVDEYEDFDVTKDYYDFLKIDSNAKLNDILAAYSNLSATIIEDDVMSQEDKEAQMDELTEALRVLSNDELRALYDEARAKYLRNNKITRHVVRVVDEEEADEEKTNKAKFILGLLTTAAVIAILYFGGKALVDNISNKFNENKKPVIEQEDPNYTDDKDVIVDEEPKDEEDNTVDNTVDVKVNYYGDINDEKLVTERATILTNQFSQNGVVNIATGYPYTIGEMEGILRYSSGIGTDEELQKMLQNDVNDPFTAIYNYTTNENDKFLNSIIGVSNMPLFTKAVNMNGVDWEIIKANDPALYESLQMDLASLTELQKTTPKIEFVDTMLFGEVSEDTYAYLKMLEEKLYVMLYSTDQKEIDECYFDATYSLTVLTSQKDYTFTWQGKTYTVNSSNFINNQNTSPGNLLQRLSCYIFTFDSLLNVGETLDNGNIKYTGYDEASGDYYNYTQVKAGNGTNHYFEIHDESITIDESNNIVIYDADSAKKELGLDCYFEDTSDLIVDDNGFILIPKDAYNENLSALIQINTNNKTITWYSNALYSLSSDNSSKTLYKGNN